MLRIAESGTGNNKIKGTGIDFISALLLPSKRFNPGIFGQGCNAYSQDIQTQNMSTATSRPNQTRVIS
jgi:hypothetical protein